MPNADSVPAVCGDPGGLAGTHCKLPLGHDGMHSSPYFSGSTAWGDGESYYDRDLGRWRSTAEWRAERDAQIDGSESPRPTQAEVDAVWSSNTHRVQNDGSGAGS